MARPGQSWLKQNHPRAAAMSFRRQLEDDPGAIAAHVGLGRSLAQQGKCVEALDELAPYVGTLPFNVDAALDAAVCSRRLGYDEDALWFDRYALSIDPTHARAGTNLVIDLDAVGDTLERDALLIEMAAWRDDRDASLFATAALAVRHGDLDTFDILKRSWREEGRTLRELRRLEAQTWLDVDDPITAWNVIAETKSMRKSFAELILRAESRRRLGDPDGAARMLDQGGKRRMEGVDVDAQRALILVDLGQLREAEVALAAWTDVMEPDALAARWYVARARGHDAEAAQLAARWRVAEVNPLRSLDQLVPSPQ